MTTGRINQVAWGPTCGARQPRSRRQRAQRHHRSWLVHARRFATRLSAARQYCTARAGRETHRSRHRCPPTSRCSPRRRLGSPRGQMTLSSRLFRGRADRGVWLAPNNRGQQTTGTNTEQTPIDHVQSADQHQPALSADTTFPANAQHRPASRVLPPRLMHSLQARRHCPTVSHSPKWPPWTLLSVIAVRLGEKRATRRPFKEKP